jgi:hypothetical protein
MTALPVAHYLHELSGESSRRGRTYSGGVGDSDIENRIGEAHARGVLEGRAAALVDQDQALARQQAAFDQKLAAERQKWAAEQGVILGELLVTQLRDIEDRIAGQVSRVLKPVVADHVRGRAVDELARMLEGMLAKGDYAKVTVSGPEDLLAPVEARLSGLAAGVSFLPADGVDLVVSADETILETRIGSWVQAINGDGS